jgi:hypothetical protein
MSISFVCACGKSFAVADEYAGKRTKCPACGSALTVPTPAAESAPPAAEAEEDAAYRALMEAPESSAAERPAREPAAAKLSSAPPNREPPPPTPYPKRGPKVATRSTKSPRERRGPAIHITPGVLGGLVSMLVAVVWFVVAYQAGWIYFYPPVMFVFGFVAVVRGLLGYSED